MQRMLLDERAANHASLHDLTEETNALALQLNNATLEKLALQQQLSKLMEDLKARAGQLDQEKHAHEMLLEQERAKFSHERLELENKINILEKERSDIEAKQQALQKQMQNALLEKCGNLDEQLIRVINETKDLRSQMADVMMEKEREVQEKRALHRRNSTLIQSHQGQKGQIDKLKAELAKQQEELEKFMKDCTLQEAL